MITSHKTFSFLAIAVFFQAMGGLMGWITSQSLDGWYQELARSPFNPPDYAFGIAWTILYKNKGTEHRIAAVLFSHGFELGVESFVFHGASIVCSVRADRSTHCNGHFYDGFLLQKD